MNYEKSRGESIKIKRKVLVNILKGKVGITLLCVVLYIIIAVISGNFISICDPPQDVVNYCRNIANEVTFEGLKELDDYKSIKLTSSNEDTDIKSIINNGLMSVDYNNITMKINFFDNDYKVNYLKLSKGVVSFAYVSPADNSFFDIRIHRNIKFKIIDGNLVDNFTGGKVEYYLSRFSIYQILFFFTLCILLYLIDFACILKENIQSILINMYNKEIEKIKEQQIEEDNKGDNEEE